MKLRAFSTSFLVPLLVAAVVQASESVTVALHDGSQIKGSFAGGGSDDIRVLVAGQTLTLKTATIDYIKFESGPVAAAKQGFAPATPQGIPVTPVQVGATIQPIPEFWCGSSIRPIQPMTNWESNIVLRSTSQFFRPKVTSSHLGA
jgi:hypothetical protein